VPSFHPSPYEDGIQCAQEKGLIEIRRGKKTFGPQDAYSHLPSKDSGKIDVYNARALSDIFIRTLETLRSIDALKIVELGHGTGAASAQMKVLLPDAEITGVSRTPTNPHVPLPPFHALFRQLETVLADHEDVLSPGVLKLRDEVRRNAAAIGIPDIVSVETELGTKILGELKTPFLSHQIIGNFPNDIRFPQKSVSIFYENTGPMFHLPERNVYHALNALSPDGIAIFGRTHVTLIKALLQQTRAFGQAVFYGGDEDKGALVVGPEHELHPGPRRPSGRINLVRFFDERRRRALS
jgi:hypothetical protein